MNAFVASFNKNWIWCKKFKLCECILKINWNKNLNITYEMILNEEGVTIQWS